MAKSVCGAAFSPSVSLSIPLLVKYTRIVRAVKNLLFPPSLAEKLSLRCVCLSAGSREILIDLQCSHIWLVFPGLILPGELEAQQGERAAVLSAQAVFKLGLMRGESMASVSEYL